VLVLVEVSGSLAGGDWEDAMGGDCDEADSEVFEGGVSSPSEWAISHDEDGLGIMPTCHSKLEA